MSYENDILVELSEGVLRQMLSYLRVKPESIREHHLLYNYLINLNNIKTGSADGTVSSRFQHTFYGHRNGKIENCTYVAITPEKDYWINTCTLEKSGAELLECIAETKRINWLQTPISVSVNAEYFEEFNKIVGPKRKDWVYDKPEHIYYISKENVRKMPNPKIPDDLYIGEIPIDFANEINETWDYRYNGSKEVIETSLRLNGGTGLFRKSDKTPIAWILTNDFFAIGFLQTVETERRKGYGSTVSIIEMKRIVKEHNVDIFIFLVDGNTASENMHKRLGFEKVNECRWMVR